MSKRTRLLSRLKHTYKNRAKYVLDVTNMDLELIIEALEKQIGKKPKILEINYYNQKCISHECICCNESVGELQNYCGECGQKILWEGEKR